MLCTINACFMWCKDVPVGVSINIERQKIQSNLQKRVLVAEKHTHWAGSRTVVLHLYP